MRSSLLLTVASTVGLALAAPSPAPVPAPAPGAGAVSESGLNLADPALDPALLTAAFSSSPAPNTLSKRAYATTANELVDGTPCRAVTVIYARGTTQNVSCPLSRAMGNNPPPGRGLPPFSLMRLA